MTNEVAKEYAIALFDIALEKNILDKITEELIILTEIINEDNNITKLLSHPQLSKVEKKEIVKKIFNSVNQTLLNFIYVIVDNNRFVDINDIKREFINLYNEYLNILEVEAITAIPITDTQVSLLEKKLAQKYRRKINIKNIIDTSIIGGMVLKINNQIIDYTIKTQLQSLKSHILKQT